MGFECLPVNTYEPEMNILPMIISFPRCGFHHLRFLLEAYFDRPGLRNNGLTTLMPFSHRKDFMWHHDHDMWCELPFFNKVLYLYREPVATISSFTYSKKRDEANKEYGYEEIAIVLAKMYKEHLKKYLVSYPNKVIIMRYEKLQTDEKYNEFNIVCKYFNTNINNELFDSAFKRATREAVVNNVIKHQKKVNKSKYYDKFLLSEEYAEYKNEFKTKYSNVVNDIIFDDKLCKFLNYGDKDR